MVGAGERVTSVARSWGFADSFVPTLWTLKEECDLQVAASAWGLKVPSQMTEVSFS